MWSEGDVLFTSYKFFLLYNYVHGEGEKKEQTFIQGG